MRTAKHRLIWCTILIATLVLAAVATACGNGGSSTPVPPGTPVPSNTPLPTFTPTPTLTPSPTPNPSFPMQTTHFSFGIDVDLFYKDYDEVLGYVDELGVEWVRQQVWWQDIEGAPGYYIWDELDNVVDAMGRHHRKLLVSIVRSPSWATDRGGPGMPSDPDDLGNFLAAMAERYRGRIQAYEIWNEQNYAVENDGYVEGAGRYVELLKVAYTRIKAADPLAMVLFGPLTPTGTNDPSLAVDDITYLREAYEYNAGEVKGYFDVLAAHVAGTLNPPDLLWPDNPSPPDSPGWRDHSTHYFRHVENIRRVMEQYGDGDKQIWLTEFGWASIEGITDWPELGYEYAAENTAQEQADYIVAALERGRTLYQPWMGAMFVWNLNFARTNPPSDQKAAFGLINAGGQPRPAFEALKEYVARYSRWP